MKDVLKYAGIALIAWFAYQKLVNGKPFVTTYDEGMAALKSCCKKNTVIAPVANNNPQ